MSDEEKKAIERLNIYKEKIKDELYPTIDFEEEKAIGIILNLIEKQQKEIEELKKPKYLLNAKTGEITTINNSEFISKDKIKAKIEEIKEEIRHYLEINDEYNAQICDCIIEEYESLLEKE